MARIHCIRTLRGCEPIDDEGREKFKRWKIGETLACDIVKPRDGVQHRRYMGLIRMTYDNIDDARWPSFEHFRKAMQLEAGHFDDIVSASTGEVYRVPRSVSFSDMDELEFAPVFAAVMAACAKLLGNMDLDILADEVARYAGV